MKDWSILVIAAIALVLTIVWYALPLPPDAPPPPPVVQSPSISTPASSPPTATPVVPVAPPAETPKQ